MEEKNRVVFRGLFIGIDRYQSPDANNLNCAVRDAKALHALFTDTLKKQCENKLLTNETATKKTIEDAFEGLCQASEDDVVFISYSGHGSDTHEIVPHDYNSHDVKNTSISLEKLQTWFEKIPAKTVVLLLDCCFSGGLGAKVLRSEMRPRMTKSVDTLLNELCGEGRVILTASSAEEAAWENQKVGHGLLTYFFLEALKGVEEVVDAGKISILKLLEYVSRKVKDAASNYGHPQNPALRGTIDAHIMWPVFIMGDLYKDYFPDFSDAKATSELESLKGFGFPDKVIECWASSISSLNDLQLAAINDHRILEGNHVVVSAPTSSGKTMVGELAALKSALDNKKALFLFPLKALVNDKLQQFTSLYEPFGIKTVEATGESDDISDLVKGRYDIALLTYEKFLAVVLGNPHVLEQVGTVIVDEVQMIADKSRGANLEFILTLLRMKRADGIEPQVIALSAVIGDTYGLEGWLNAGLLRKEERPVPLDEGLISRNGRFKYIDGETHEEKELEAVVQPIYSGKHSSQDIVIPLVQKIVDGGGQVIVFREWKVHTVACAEYLARDTNLPRADKAISELSSTDPSNTTNRLLACLENGTAFHNSDLSRDERVIVEKAFRRGEIKVIAATTTLAMGINTPASDVIVVGLDHPNSPYSIAEYKNLVGRAGRLGFSEKGTSYLIAKEGRDEHHYWTHYILGTPEDVTSMFLDGDTDPRSLIIKIISMAQKSYQEGPLAKDIIRFLEGSFGAYCQEKRHGSFDYNQGQLQEALADLERHKLITQGNDNRVQLTELGMIAGESAVSIKSFVRFIECIQRADAENLSDPDLITIAQTSEELDQVNIRVHGRSIQEHATWPQELARMGVQQSIIRALEYESRETKILAGRRKKAVAALGYISEMKLEQIEELLSKHVPEKSFAGAIRGVSDRTCDVLPTVGQIIEYFNPSVMLSDRVEKLITRLAIGVHANMVFLANELGSKISRGDYQELMRAGYISFEVIENAKDEELLICIGSDPIKLISIRNAVKDFREFESGQTDPQHLPLYVA